MAYSFLPSCDELTASARSVSLRGTTKLWGMYPKTNAKSPYTQKNHP